MKLHTRAFALACGILSGAALFLFVWKLIALGGTIRRTAVPGWMFRRPRIGPLWSVAGGLAGFLDGCLAGAAFAWLYNRFVDALGGGEERRSVPRRHEHDHLPWLFALAHRMPGIHA